MWKVIIKSPYFCGESRNSCIWWLECVTKFVIFSLFRGIALKKIVLSDLYEPYIHVEKTHQDEQWGLILFWEHSITCLQWFLTRFCFSFTLTSWNPFQCETTHRNIIHFSNLALCQSKIPFFWHLAINMLCGINNCTHCIRSSTVTAHKYLSLIFNLKFLFFSVSTYLSTRFIKVTKNKVNTYNPLNIWLFVCKLLLEFLL